MALHLYTDTLTSAINAIWYSTQLHGSKQAAEEGLASKLRS